MQLKWHMSCSLMQNYKDMEQKNYTVPDSGHDPDPQPRLD